MRISNMPKEKEEDVNLEELAKNDLEGQEEITQEIKFTPIEQKAYDQGWKPEDQFEGDKDNWKPAKEYVSYGKMVNQINDVKRLMNDQKSNFDSQLENVNKYHKATREAEIKKLKAGQREATKVSDLDTYDKNQEQIDQLEKEEPVKTVETESQPPEISAWIAKNSWFNDANDERGGVAESVWKNCLTKNPTWTNSQVLAHVDSRIESMYPTTPTNPRRGQSNLSENNTTPTRKSSKSLTMNDLTPEERDSWNSFGEDLFKTKDNFLKTVAATRGK